MSTWIQHYWASLEFAPDEPRIRTTMCDGTEFYQRVWVTSYHGVRLFDGSRRKHESYHGAKTFFQNLTTPCWHVTSHAVNFGPRTGLAVADTESWQNITTSQTHRSWLTECQWGIKTKIPRISIIPLHHPMRIFYTCSCAINMWRIELCVVVT